MRPRVALLAGATGLVGGNCLRQLLESPAYSRIIALLRRPLGIDHPRLEERIVDWERIRFADLTCDDAFCALGTTMAKAGSQDAFRSVDFGYSVNLARRALECEARRFVLVSSVGAGAGSSNFYLRVKGETEAAIAAMPFEAVHIFRPSFLIGERNEHRAAERIAVSLALTLRWAFVGPARKYRPVHADQVACAMIAAAQSSRLGLQVFDFAGIQSLCAIRPD